MLSLSYIKNNSINHLFKEISITNFRGFDSLIIKGLQRINIFVGANNVGKTSILEAAFMLSGMSNPLISNRVNYLRTASFTNLDSARYLFHNVDFNNKPLLKGMMNNGGIRKMTFSPVTIHNETNASSNFSTNQSAIRQLNFEFDQQENKNGFAYHSTLFVKNDGSTQQEADSNYHESLNALFIPVDKNDANTTTNFSTLVKHNRKAFVTNALHDFDPSIESVEALPDGLYLKIVGLKELLLALRQRREAGTLGTESCKRFFLLMMMLSITSAHMFIREFTSSYFIKVRILIGSQQNFFPA